MIGYKVLSKDGLKGPFKKSSIVKAINSAMLPLQAKLLELDSGRYVFAAELVGEQIDHAAKAKPAPLKKADHPAVKEAVKQMASQPLKLAEDTPTPANAASDPEETPRVILKVPMPLKKARLPMPRKLAQRAAAAAVLGTEAA